ncbi:MAG TPA: hypothetical protein PL000_22890 [Anaerolineales bacterium]|nr:hypothetical protein [Anaerolineales bacterium]
MSKCREAFEELYGKQELVRSITNPEFYADFEVTRAWRYWQAAWNARGKVDAEICRNRIGPLDTAFDVEARACAEAIEQEIEK